MLSSIKFYNWAQLSPQRIRLRSIICTSKIVGGVNLQLDKNFL